METQHMPEARLRISDSLPRIEPRRRPYGPARICCVPVLISLGRQFESRLPRHCSS